MVERNEMSLENRRGPLGPSGVRIPPPPLTTESPATTRDQQKRGGHQARLSHRLKSPRTAMDCRATVAHRRRDPSKGRRLRAPCQRTWSGGYAGRPRRPCLALRVSLLIQGKGGSLCAPPREEARTTRGKRLQTCGDKMHRVRKRPRRTSGSGRVFGGKAT
jgi:hypothetical protein